MTQGTSPQITLCIPVYNEEATLPELLQNISSYFAKFLIPYQVIFCLDPSSDRSAEILQQAVQKNASLRLIQNSRRRGRAESLRQALLEAEAPYLLSASADLSVPLGELTKLLQNLSEHSAAIAFGTRTDKKASPFLSLDTKKNRFELTYISIFWEQKKRTFKDPFSSAFVLKKDFVVALLDGHPAKGWYLTPFIQKQIEHQNLPFVEVPIHSTSGGGRHFPYWKEYLRWFFRSLRH